MQKYTPLEIEKDWINLLPSNIKALIPTATTIYNQYPGRNYKKCIDPTIPSTMSIYINKNHTHLQIYFSRYEDYKYLNNDPKIVYSICKFLAVKFTF